MTRICQPDVTTARPTMKHRRRGRYLPLAVQKWVTYLISYTSANEKRSLEVPPTTFAAFPPVIVNFELMYSMLYLPAWKWNSEQMDGRTDKQPEVESNRKRLSLETSCRRPIFASCRARVSAT